MELLVKIVNQFKLSTVFTKISVLDVSQLLSSPLAKINQKFSCEQQKSYITVFWNSSAYYPAEILPIQSQQDVKCV